MSDLIDMVDAMWAEAEKVPNGAKDEYWMAADLRVRIVALCQVVQKHAHAAGVAAERARVVALIDARLTELEAMRIMEWDKSTPIKIGVYRALLDKVRAQ